MQMEGQELQELNMQATPDQNRPVAQTPADQQQPKKPKFGENLLSTVGKIGKGVDDFVKKVGNEGVSVGKSIFDKIKSNNLVKDKEEKSVNQNDQLKSKPKKKKKNMKTKQKLHLLNLLQRRKRLLQCIKNKSSEEFDSHISIQLESNEESKTDPDDKLKDIEEKLETLKLPGASNEEEMKEVVHERKMKSRIDLSKIKIGDIIEILDLHHCIARVIKPLSSNFFLGMINHSVNYVIVLETGYLIKCEINSDSPKIAKIEEMIELDRLFKFDIKKMKKEVECRLHFINEDMDPFKPPVIQIYYIEINCFEGFREMIKFHLKQIGNTKVFIEVIED